MTSPSGRPPEALDRWLSVPRAVVILGACHALGTWCLWVDQYELLFQRPLSATVAGAGLVATWGLVLVWLIALCLPWLAIGRRTARRPHDDGVTPERARAPGLDHGLLVLGLLAVTVVVGLLFESVNLMLWLVFALWVLGFGSAGVAFLFIGRLRGDRETRLPLGRFATGRLLGPSAALAWSMFVVLETLFHRYTGTFLLAEDLTIMIHVMSDEALAMFFGPGAPWFLSALAAYALVASTVCVVVARLSGGLPMVTVEGRALAAWCAPGLLGLGLLFVLPEPDARSIVHHVHPQGDDLANLVAAPAPPGSTEEQAARALYPQYFEGDEAMKLRSAVRADLEDYGEQADDDPQGHKNVLVIFIDTLSRRNLDAWGYEREVAPRIKELAARSTRFDGARTNGGTTDLATVALFYGMRPFFAEEKAMTYQLGHGGLPFHLLARAHGVRVGMFSGDWEVWNEGYSPVFPGHCDHFQDARGHQDEHPEESRTWVGHREDQLVDELTRWMGSIGQEEGRFLAYLKFLRPHMPYFTPESLPDGWRRPYADQAGEFTVTDLSPDPARHAPLRNRYDNAVNFVDHQVGRVLDFLRTSGLEDDTAILLVADHGEAWGQHGWYNHGHHNFEEFLEVPLIVHRPGQEPSIDERMVSIMDVAPTVLELLGLPAYANHQGTSLLEPGERVVYWADSNSAARLTTLQIGPWKYTENRVTGEGSLYDMSQDSDERHDRHADRAHRQRRDALRFLLHAGNERQLEWSSALRAWPTKTLLQAPRGEL